MAWYGWMAVTYLAVGAMIDIILWPRMRAAKTLKHKPLAAFVIMIGWLPIFIWAQMDDRP